VNAHGLDAVLEQDPAAEEIVAAVCLLEYALSGAQPF
jgi:hypothetical protein